MGSDGRQSDSFRRICATRGVDACGGEYTPELSFCGGLLLSLTGLGAFTLPEVDACGGEYTPELSFCGGLLLSLTGLGAFTLPEVDACGGEYTPELSFCGGLLLSLTGLGAFTPLEVGRLGLREYAREPFFGGILLLAILKPFRYMAVLITSKSKSNSLPSSFEVVTDSPSDRAKLAFFSCANDNVSASSEAVFKIDLLSLLERRPNISI